MYFQCNSCNEKFVISIPNNAWRGYFLKEQSAIEYHEKIKQSDKNRKNVFLVIIIVLIIVLAIYSILK